MLTHRSARVYVKHKVLVTELADYTSVEKASEHRRRVRKAATSVLFQNNLNFKFVLSSVFSLAWKFKSRNQLLLHFAACIFTKSLSICLSVYTWSTHERHIWEYHKNSCVRVYVYCSHARAHLHTDIHAYCLTSITKSMDYVSVLLWIL